MAQLKYGNKRNEIMVSLAESFKNIDEEACEKLINKSNMIGLYSKKVLDMPNGLKVMEFSADGLVDNEEDWELYEWMHGRTDKTCRVYGIPKDTKNKELIENSNYVSLMRLPFGLYALRREVNNGVYSDGLYHKHKGTDGKYYLDITHRVVIFDSEGNIITHSMSDKNEAWEQFGNDPCDFFKGMNKLRQPILEHIIKHGPHKEDFEEGYEIAGRYPLGRGAIFDYTDIVLEKSKSGRYQLATMGRFSCAGAFALFDLIENKCVAYCNNTVMTFEGSKRILMDDYSIILVDFDTDCFIRKIIDVPVNTIYKYFSGSSNRSRLDKSAREGLLNSRAAYMILQEFYKLMYREGYYDEDDED